MKRRRQPPPPPFRFPDKELFDLHTPRRFDLERAVLLPDRIALSSQRDKNQIVSPYSRFGCCEEAALFLRILQRRRSTGARECESLLAWSCHHACHFALPPRRFCGRQAHGRKNGRARERLAVFQSAGLRGGTAFAHPDCPGCWVHSENHVRALLGRAGVLL